MLILASHRKSLGFSLIELMIAVALFGILASLAVPSYRAMIQNNQTRNAAESIISGLQIARGEAVKRNAAVQFDLRGINSAWTVCTRPTTPGACPSTDDATTVQSRALGEGSSTNVAVATLSGAGPSGPFVFNSLGVMISPTPSAADGIIRVGVTNSSVTGLRNLQVAIRVGGSSKMCDPALPTTDARSCP